MAIEPTKTYTFELSRISNTALHTALKNYVYGKEIKGKDLIDILKKLNPPIAPDDRNIVRLFAEKTITTKENDTQSFGLKHGNPTEHKIDPENLSESLKDIATFLEFASVDFKKMWGPAEGTFFYNNSTTLETWASDTKVVNYQLPQVQQQAGSPPQPQSGNPPQPQPQPQQQSALTQWFISQMGFLGATAVQKIKQLGPQAMPLVNAFKKGVQTDLDTIMTNNASGTVFVDNTLGRSVLYVRVSAGPGNDIYIGQGSKQPLVTIADATQAVNAKAASVGAQVNAQGNGVQWSSLKDPATGVVKFPQRIPTSVFA